jgi:hypothetical protein
MATFVEFEVLSEDLGLEVHAFGADTFKWYFTNTAPDAAADTQLSELPTEIANGNGYTTGGLTADLSQARSGGQTTVSLASPVVLTATGAVGPFRYICLYNDTAANDEVVGYLDHGSNVTMANTDTYTIPSGALVTIN